MRRGMVRHTRTHTHTRAHTHSDKQQICVNDRVVGLQDLFCPAILRHPEPWLRLRVCVCVCVCVCVRVCACLCSTTLGFRSSQ